MEHLCLHNKRQNFRYCPRYEINPLKGSFPFLSPVKGKRHHVFKLLASWCSQVARRTISEYSQTNQLIKSRGKHRLFFLIIIIINWQKRMICSGSPRLPGIGCEFQELTVYSIPTSTTCLVTQETQYLVTSSSISMTPSFSIWTSARFTG